MKTYLVSIHGSNLLINLRGEKRKYGFHTKRYVLAKSEEQAERNALSLLLNDTDLQRIILNHQNDPPSLMVEHIQEVEKPEEHIEKEMKINYYKEDGS